MKYIYQARSKEVNIICQHTGRSIGPDEVVWVRIAKDVRTEITEAATEPICAFCRKRMRYAEGVPGHKHHCDGRVGEGSDIFMIPPSHLPDQYCGGQNVGSGDSYDSFQGNPGDGGDQFNDDSLAKSCD